ncbi:MAG TPA: DNA polymerase III subunit gamma/tau [Thermoanaerobaculia bacterium]|nr:DNA polymerase III subunit gamma/tau [Thermoanaerobaculia bacterium]
MTYQVLARKWRPQDFASLIGQQPIVTALTNALGEGKITQAYLFSGIRGVGKTTAARLLAKALNCEQGPTATPCNVCTACREITGGSDLDVIEVDAATYSKVEQVRELTESLRYGPARDRYKVVVLDEIHRLSRQAFDALLKIVEEPPAHLVFVFATTEAEAVPATILSRCQEFHFRRVSSDEVSRHLRSICEAEDIRASEASLRLIARAGEGSVRDAVALLDQLATFGAGGIDDEDAARLLGGLDTALLHDLLAAIVSGDGAVVAELAGRLEVEGWDPRSVYSQFLTYCRNALHLALAGPAAAETTPVDLPQDDAAALAEVAAAAGYENLLRLLQQLLAGEPIVRHSESGYIAAEIAWLRAAEMPKLVRVEELLGGGPGRPRSGAAADRRSPAVDPGSSPASARPSPGGGDAPTSEVATSDSPPPAPRRPAAARPPETMPPKPAASPARRSDEGAAGAGAAGRSPAEGGGQPAEPVAPATGAGDTGSSGAAAEPSVASILAEVRRVKPPLAARLEAGTELAIEDGRLLIRYPVDDDDLRERFGMPGFRRALDEAVARSGGPPDGGWEARAELPATRSDGAAAVDDDPTEAAVAPPHVAEHPTVQTVLHLFDGRIEAVEEDEVEVEEEEDDSAGPEPMQEGRER